MVDAAADLVARLVGGSAERAAALREAAAMGLAEAQTLYGQCLLDGNGVLQDRHAAVAWFWKAAEQRHAPAINMLGRCYDLGWGVAVDKARAAEWYRVAVELGLDWAMYNLATLLALGQGVPEDRAGALALLHRAVDVSGHAKALNLIGGFYEDGWVVAADMAEAASYYARAAEGGDFRGMFNHARMLIAGKNSAGAQPWLDRAIAEGTPRFVAQVRSWLAQHPAAIAIE